MHAHLKNGKIIEEDARKNAKPLTECCPARLIWKKLNRIEIYKLSSYCIYGYIRRFVTVLAIFSQAPPLIYGLRLDVFPKNTYIQILFSYQY